VTVRVEDGAATLQLYQNGSEALSHDLLQAAFRALAGIRHADTALRLLGSTP